jgi:hypothetical protein
MMGKRSKKMVVGKKEEKSLEHLDATARDNRLGKQNLLHRRIDIASNMSAYSVYTA